MHMKKDKNGREILRDLILKQNRSAHWKVCEIICINLIFVNTQFYFLCEQRLYKEI